MATLKSRDIKNMNQEDRNKRILELKLELIKAKANVAKTGVSRAKEIRKLIARIKTINNIIVKK